MNIILLLIGSLNVIFFINNWKKLLPDKIKNEMNIVFKKDLEMLGYTLND